MASNDTFKALLVEKKDNELVASLKAAGAVSVILNENLKNV